MINTIPCFDFLVYKPAVVKHLAYFNLNNKDMKAKDTLYIFVAAIIVGIISSISTFVVSIDTAKYIEENVVNYDKLDSILDVRLGSGCDLYVDSCEVYYK